MGCYGAITQLPANNGYETYDTSNDPLNNGNVGQWGANALFGCYGGSKSVSDREKYFMLRIVQFYLNKGLTLDQSCAIAGNIRSEGGYCQGAQNWVKDSKDISFGMFAMYRGNCGVIGKGGAYCSYKPWCEKNKRVYWLLDSQMEYMFYYINNGKPALKKYFSSDGDGTKESLQELCFQWASLVEVCGGAGGPCQQRNHKTQTNRYNNANRVKNIVLNWQYFTQNGECKSSSVTSNIDTPSSGTWSGLSIDTSNMSDTCKRLMNGLSALMGGFTSAGPNTQEILSDISLPSGANTQTVSNGNNDGSPILFGDSWAYLLDSEKYGKIFSTKTGGYSVNADSGGTLRNGIRVKQTATYGSSSYEGLLSRVQKFKLNEKKPKFILCHIGYNDIHKGYDNLYNDTKQQQKMRSDLKELISAFQGYRTYMIAIPKTNEKCTEELNNNVVKANTILREECNGTVKYIPYTQQTIDTLRKNYMKPCTGKLDERFHIFSKQGNEYYLEEIRKQIKSIDNGFDIYTGDTTENKAKKK